MKILIPLDGSKLAEDALHFARLLAPLDGLTARLLTVVDPFEGFNLGVTEDEWRAIKDRRRSVAQDYVRDQEARLAGCGVPTTIAVTEGHPAQEIIREAASADLVVMSTHGLSGIQRWRRGSVTDKVVRAGIVNTIVVGPHVEDGNPPDKISNIMLPLDGSALAELALPVAMTLAAGLHAGLHLVNAVVLPYMADGGTGYVLDGDIYQDVLDGMKEYLEKVKARTSGVDVVTAVVQGSPAVLLANYINENAIDLVVLTSHGRGGLVRTALGSVTDRLIGERAPVLVVHAKEEEKK